jgi:hypothetical protein
MSGQWPPEWEDPAEEFPQEADQLNPDTEARLSEVTAYLSSVPAPVLPDAVQARISAALAAEAAARASTAPADVSTPVRADSGIPAPRTDGTTRAARTDGTTPAESANGISPAAPADGITAADGARTLGPPPARARTGRHRGGSGRRMQPRTLLRSGSLVAVCLVLAGFGFLLSRGAPEASSSSAAAAAPAAGSSEAAGSLGQSSAGVSVPGPGRPEYGENAANFSVTESGTRYQSTTLAAQVRARLAANGGTSSASESAPGVSAPSASASASDSGRVSSPSAGLRGCVSHLTDGVPLRLVDQATYQGKPAYVIASSSRVWVVGLSCTAADPELIASVPLAGLPGTSAP